VLILAHVLTAVVAVFAGQFSSRVLVLAALVAHFDRAAVVDDRLVFCTTVNARHVPDI
jgi:hypothetical protein